MGYTTEFSGNIMINLPLNEREIDYLNKFSQSRRMLRKKGDYYVDDPQVNGSEPDIIDNNKSTAEQPGLWCQWVVNEGKFIEWDGEEKFYKAEQWMWYILQHFIGKDPIAKRRHPKKFAFLQGHDCNGTIKAQGEDHSDTWMLIVKNNFIYISGNKGYGEHSGERSIDNRTLAMKYCAERDLGSGKCEGCKERFKCFTGGSPPKILFNRESYW